MGGTLGVLAGRTELRDVLSQVPGLRLRDAHRGTLGSGKQQASVCVETLECICVRLEVTTPVPATLQRELPGNLRFARDTRGLFLVADIHAESQGIVASFEELDRGLRQATRSLRQGARKRPRKNAVRETRHGRGRAPDASAVQEAVDALPWGEGAIVHRDDGYEVRLSIGDSSVAVQIVSTGTGLHVHRSVMDSIHDKDMVDGDIVNKIHKPLVEQAVDDQAQRLNARFRWARLTASEAGVTAESHLHTALITPRALAIACQAVAAAARHSAPLLSVLAHQGEVGRLYSELFLNQQSPGGEPR